ncbi:hypothetical protein BFAG_03649 [Bacteroides fragilis 3_1_12]|uniref:Uncharacterized protein n=1 Tax=Bacteroides fragilis 3_1_12 TaxID=457424 RepID=A0ABN0BPW0_BACFG|nr:hypothetical protein BFAG_03649 [Bacteroides fragilis 3_1_12]
MLNSATKVAIFSTNSFIILIYFFVNNDGQKYILSRNKRIKTIFFLKLSAKNRQKNEV